MLEVQGRMAVVGRRSPRKQWLIRIPATTELTEVRCTAPRRDGTPCKKLLFVGQITGVIQVWCERCDTQVQVEPGYPVSAPNGASVEV